MKKKLFNTSNLEKIAVDNDDAYTLWTVTIAAQNEWINSLDMKDVSKKLKDLDKSLAKSFSKEQLKVSLQPYLSAENEETLRQLIG